MRMATELSYIFAFGVGVAFLILLVALGMPSSYSLLGTFDLAVLGVSFLGIGISCTLLMGAGCIIGGTIFSLGTMVVYIGAGALAPTLTSFALLKAVILTPIMIGFTYIQGKLARGGG